MKSTIRKLAARLSKSEAGFTLIEMLVVVGIIVALAAVIVPLVVQFAGKGDEGAEDSEEETVQTAMYTMMADKEITEVKAHDTATDNAVKDWSALPLDEADNSVVRSINGYLGLTGSETTLYYYCWSKTGKITKQIVGSAGACA